MQRLTHAARRAASAAPPAAHRIAAKQLPLASGRVPRTFFGSQRWMSATAESAEDEPITVTVTPSPKAAPPPVCALTNPCPRITDSLFIRRAAAGEAVLVSLLGPCRNCTACNGGVHVGRGLCRHLKQVTKSPRDVWGRFAVASCPHSRAPPAQSLGIERYCFLAPASGVLAFWFKDIANRVLQN
jgi:hypothetical protein